MATLSLTHRARALVVAAAAAAALFSASSTAHADESRHGAGYVQLQPLGVTLDFASVGGASSTDARYPLELHGGYHLSGRHDGFVVGATQRFTFGDVSAGATVARLGWDFAFALGDSELTVAPFAFVGARYPFSQGDASAYFGFGVEGRYFLFSNAHGAATAAGAPVRLTSAPATPAPDSTRTRVAQSGRSKSSDPGDKRANGRSAPPPREDSKVASAQGSAPSNAARAGGVLDGFYLVLKPLDLGFGPGTASVVTLSFQAGAGLAF